jgi:hypothetical protein
MAQKRSTNKAQQRGQAAQAKVTNAEPAAAPKPKGSAKTPAAVPGTPTRVERARQNKSADLIAKSEASGVPVPPSRVPRTGYIPKPQAAAKPRGKVAAQKATDAAAAQAESEKKSADFLEAGRAHGDVSILRNLAINEHAKHVKMINQMKKKFPAVPAIQALQPKTLAQITQELAQQPKPVKHVKMTPTKTENFELNKGLVKNVDMNTQLLTPLASRNSTVELPGYEAEKRKPAGIQAAKKAVPFLVAQANKLPKQPN